MNTQASNTDARVALLRIAWEQILNADNTDWIKNLIEQVGRKQNTPGNGAGTALKRLLAIGADPRDLTEIVRVMQYESLFGFLYSLEDPTDSSFYWRIFRTDESGAPLDSVDAAHESLLSADPAGRELRISQR